MKYMIIFLPEALADSEEIRNYLSQYYHSTVTNFFAHLRKRTNSLKANPYIAPQHQEQPSYRKLVVGEYLVFYKVDEKKKQIKIHRILHGSRDISRYM